MNTINSFVSGTVALILRAVLFLAGLVFVASLFVVAVLLALVAIGAALLTGRKPVLRARFGATQRAAWQRFRPGAGRLAPRPAGEVIDVESRDVTPVFERGHPAPPPQHG